MADSVPITGLPSASAITGAELEVIVQGGITSKSPKSATLTYINNNAQLASPNQVTNGAYAGGFLSISSDTTLTYPLPSWILCDTTASNINLTFPAFDLTKCRLGQPIIVVNTDTGGLNHVRFKNSANTQLLTDLQQAQTALLVLNTAAPDGIAGQILGAAALKALSFFLHSDNNLSDLTNPFLARGYSGVASINENTGTAKTLANADDWTETVMMSSSANLITVPSGLGAYRGGIITQGGTGLTSVTAGSGVTFIGLGGTPTTVKPYQRGDSVILIKLPVTSETYLVKGNITV